MNELAEIVGNIVLILFGLALLLAVVSNIRHKAKKQKIKVRVYIIDPEHKKLKKQKKKAERKSKRINKKYIKAVRKAKENVSSDSIADIPSVKFDQDKEIRFD